MRITARFRAFAYSRSLSATAARAAAGRAAAFPAA